MKRFIIGLALALGLTAVAAVPANASNDWSRAAAVQRANGLKGKPPALTYFKKNGKWEAKAQAEVNAKLLTLQYMYEGGGQGGITSGGCQANFEVPNPLPSLDTGAGDAHTLAEVACKKTVNGSLQAVEIGWTVDQALNGHTNADLFGYSWVNGAGKGYNESAGSGFVDFTPGDSTDDLGRTLTPGDTWQLRLQYNATGTVGWWAWAGKFNGSTYVGNWVGHWPATHWTSASPAVNTFTGNTDVQYFWEVLANSATPCTDMGNGVLGNFTGPTGNFIGSTTNISGPTSVNAGFDIPSGYAGYNHALSATTRTLRGGGPGSC